MDRDRPTGWPVLPWRRRWQGSRAGGGHAGSGVSVDFADRSPDALSGRQAQRPGIARAIVREGKRQV